MDDRLPVTVGVEEEFVLVDPASGEVTLAGPGVVGLLVDEPAVMPEFLQFQIETATGVCRTLSEVRTDLVRLRRLLSGAAGRAGCLLVASGVAPFGVTPGICGVTPDPRYRALAGRFPSLVADAGTCACHVHVAIPDPELGVRVLAGLRPWLGTLLALTANSPFHHGVDSGWDSARYPLWSRWPTARPPGAWSGLAEYEADVSNAIRSGAAMDARCVYYYARLSPRHPTVEVRIADVCLDVEDAVLLAGLVRALVVTGLREAESGVRPPSVADSLVEASLAAAARTGTAGPGIDVSSGSKISHESLVEALLGRVRPALRAYGDLDDVERRLKAVGVRGNGAARQRALRAASPSPAHFVGRLAEVTLGE